MRDFTDVEQKYVDKLDFGQFVELHKKIDETNGNLDIIKWVKSQDEIPDLEAELKKHFGYNQFRPGQREIVALLAKKHNVLASCPTAFGKSICYQLPALMMPGMTVVVSPLISLMKDQVDNLRKKGIQSGGFINSSQTTEERQKEIKRIINKKTKILYVSPERLASRSFLEILKSVKIGLLIVDEAHCISQWGHDFRPDYLNISNLQWEIHPAAIGMFTATATEEVKKDIIQQMRLYEDENYKKDIKEYYVNRVNFNVDRNNLKNIVIPVDSTSQKYHAIVDIINTIKGKGIVYCGTRKRVEEVSKHLDRMEGIKSDYYHAGRPEHERLNIQNSFFNNNGIQVIVATNAFGMGIDKPDIRYVIHWDMPGTLENYVQEAGRAGRDGKQSVCILFYKPGDEELHEYFAKEAKTETDVLYNTYKYIYNSETVGTDRYNHKYKAIHQDTFNQDLQIPEDKIKIILSQLNKFGLIRWYPNLPYILNIEVKIYEKDEKLQYLATQDQHQITELCKKFNMNPEDLYDYLIEQKDDENINFWGKEESLIFNVTNHGAPLAKKTICFQSLFGYIKSCYEKQINKIEQHMEYIRTNECRAKVVKNYFGETHTEDCGNCDNCNKHLQNIDSEMLFASLWLWAVTDEMKAPPKPVDFTGTHYEDEFDEFDGYTEFVVDENGNILQQETINANTGEPVEWEGDIF